MLHLEGFKTCVKHGPSGHKTRQVTANTLPCSGSPLPAPGHVAILHLEGFKTCAKHGPSRHKTPLWAFTALPLPSQVTANTLPCSGSPAFASAWPVAILHLEGFKTCAKHGPSRHKTPLWAFTALPLPSQVTANKHGPSRHKTPLWAFTALPLPSQLTGNTLPCSSSPLPAPGQSSYSI